MFFQERSGGICDLLSLLSPSNELLCKPLVYRQFNLDRTQSISSSGRLKAFTGKICQKPDANTVSSEVVIELRPQVASGLDKTSSNIRISPVQNFGVEHGADFLPLPPSYENALTLDWTSELISSVGCTGHAVSSPEH